MTIKNQLQKLLMVMDSRLPKELLITDSDCKYAQGYVQGSYDSLEWMNSVDSQNKAEQHLEEGKIALRMFIEFLILHQEESIYSEDYSI